MTRVDVRQATPADGDSVAGLFDQYRAFQGQQSDLQAARTFILARLVRGESIIFVASRAEADIGFAQLYPSFSSVALAEVFILNDLFVSPAARKAGVATALLAAIETYAWQHKACRITLNVARSNESAQALYRRSGWVEDQQFFMFHRHAPPDRVA